jgi:hypothetical protein
LREIPQKGKREFAVNTTFHLRFIIDGIEAHNTLKEDMKLRVRARVFCNFKQGAENIYDNSVVILDIGCGGIYSLTTMSWNVSTDPLAL